MNDKETQLELISRYLDGLATPGDAQALETLILNDSAVRRDFLRYAHLDAALVGNHSPQIQAVLTSSPGQNHAGNPTSAASHAKHLVRMSKRPWTAAVFGLIIGLFSASMVWAYVAPIGREITTLMTEDFESSSLEISSHVPLQDGIWRGDRAEIVEEERGVKPPTGKKMLRFIREGWVGKPRQSGSHIADIYQLIDVRRFQQHIANDRSVVQVSASLNSLPYPVSERYGCAVSVYALDADSVPKSAINVGTRLTNDSTAMARSIRTILDQDSSNWQSLTAELQLPSNTAFLVVRVHISQILEANGKSPFNGAYVDDVTVSLRRRIPLL